MVLNLCPGGGRREDKGKKVGHCVEQTGGSVGRGWVDRVLGSGRGASVSAVMVRMEWSECKFPHKQESGGTVTLTKKTWAVGYWLQKEGQGCRTQKLWT